MEVCGGVVVELLFCLFALTFFLVAAVNNTLSYLNANNESVPQKTWRTVVFALYWGAVGFYIIMASIMTYVVSCLSPPHCNALQ